MPARSHPSVEAAAYTVSQVAALLNMSRAGVYRLIHSGQLHKVPGIGPRRIRIPRAEIDRRLSASGGRQPAPEAPPLDLTPNDLRNT